MNEITQQFMRDKAFIHPISGKPLSKRVRLDSMYTIITNSEYNYTYSLDEQLLANEYIAMIIKE